MSTPDVAPEGQAGSVPFAPVRPGSRPSAPVGPGPQGPPEAGPLTSSGKAHTKSEIDPGKHAPDFDQALGNLKVVGMAHTAASTRAAELGERRARAAWAARRAGATLGQIAAATGMARGNVPALIRRGEELSAAR